MMLKPWREIITPHKNVLEGTFKESEFAADISKVVNGTASPEYQDPSLFFERTFITEGMSLLLDSVVKRLCGQGGDPVVQLQTAFGGGKTHAMLAVYHLAKNEKPAKQLPGVQTILDNAKIDELPKANIAVLDGNDLSVSHPRKRGGVTVNTLWGEMAWQLGKEEGYQLVELSDRDGTSPGKEILATLFERFSPCVILMDETVAYVRQFEKGKSYAGGTFESNMSFLQALTEAAGHVPSTMVMASLPESDREVGGERGKQALTQIEHLFHRIETLWKPVATEEGFEIVRRRLFSPIKDENARDAACKAFADLYISNDKFPSNTRESNYADRLKAAYPIHPEVFDRLYEDWATLENFQRTRGVLRLMAMVVHRLWSDGNADKMIMPGSLPLYDTHVRNELIRYLPQGWDPVIERDVDGKGARTTEIDEKKPMLGEVQAARRVARSVFLGSAPSESGKKVRGVNTENIRLGCTQPGEPMGRFEDALRDLTDQLHYLYSGNERYWYDTQTNLRREAEDRMSRFKRDDDLIPEIANRLKTMMKGKPFNGIHIFTSHSDIPDDQGLRLVVLSPVNSHQWHKESLAINTANEIQQWRGNQPRLNQNRLVYFAADQDSILTLYEQIKRFLAWKSIVDEKELLNLDQLRMKEAEKNQKNYDTRLTGSLLETFKWLIKPYQEPDKKGSLSKLKWEEQRVSASNENWIQTITQVLKSQEAIIDQWSPIHLRDCLQTWFWKEDRRDYSLNALWNDFCRYPYFPRLVDHTVLKETVEEGIKSKEYFGYATGKEGDKYVGLAFGKSATVYMDDDSLLVQPEAAEAQREEPSPGTGSGSTGSGSTGSGSTGSGSTGSGSTGSGSTGSGDTSTQHQEQKYCRFFGSVMLKPVSAALDFSKIAEEVIQHFSSQLGTKVTITVDIHAESNNGFDESTRRTVKENSKTLGFIQAEFEKK